MQSYVSQNQYRDFSERTHTLPVFLQPWWLDATEGRDGWDAVIVENSTGVIGVMPFVASKRAIFKKISMPKNTPTIGPFIDLTSMKNKDRIVSFNYRILEAILEALPKADFVSFSLSPNFVYWLPLYYRGYDIEPRISYIIRKNVALGETWLKLHKGVKSDINRAERKYGLRIRESSDATELFNCCADSYSRKKRRFSLDKSTLERLLSMSLFQEKGRLLIAENDKGQAMAAAFVVFDQENAHYILGGTKSDGEKFGALSFVIWKQIEATHAAGLNFDFEGSMISSIEQKFRGFGPDVTEYKYCHWERSPMVSTAKKVARLVQSILGN